MTRILNINEAEITAKRDGIPFVARFISFASHQQRLQDASQDRVKSGFVNATHGERR